MFEPFQLPFVQKGLIEVLILSVGAGVLGTWIVLRGLAFFSHAVGTATFPGLVLADGIGFSAPLGAFGVAVAFTAAVWGLARRRGTAYDSLTALVLVGCLAAGVILASDVYHSGSNVEQLLFGSLLLVSGADIRLALVAAVAILIGNLVLGRRWLATGFDEVEGPASTGGWLEIVLLALIALATTAALSVIGALLVAAIFVAPAATVRLFADRMASWQIGSVLLAAAEGTVGLWLSVKTNAPPGATIATLSGAVFAIAAVARAIGPHRGGLALAGAVMAALLVAGCGSSGSDSGQGDCRGHDHPDRRLRPGGRRRGVGRPPDTRPEHRPPRLRTPTGRRHEHRRREDRLYERRQPGLLDGKGRLGLRQRREGRRPRGCRPGEAARRVQRSGGLPVRPALVARPAECGGGRPPDRDPALGGRRQGQGHL